MKNIFSKAVSFCAAHKRIFLLTLFAVAIACDMLNPTEGLALGLTLTPASNSAVGSQSNNLAFLSTFNVFDNFHEPKKYSELIRRFGDQWSSEFDKILILGGGADEAMDQTTWSVRYEDFIVERLKISSFTSPAAANASIGVSGADANTADMVVHADVIDNNKYYAQVGDVLNLPNGNNAKIIAKSGTTITAALSVNGASWGALANGSEIGVAWNLFAEETDQPEPRASQISEERYKSHIFKEKCRASGSELIRTPWVTKMSDGTEIPTAWAKGVVDAETRMKGAIAGASFFSQPITNTGSYFDDTRAMTGIVPWIRIGGINDTLGVFNINKLYAMGRELDRYNAPKEYILKCSGDAYIDIEKALSNLFTSDASIFAMGGALQEKDVMFGFKTITLGNRKWHIDRLNITDHPKIYNLTGYNLQNLVVVMPNAKTKDKKSGGNIPYLKYMFCAKDGKSRKFYVWGTGIYSRNATHDREDLNMLAECGTRPTASNHWGLFE